MSILGINSIFHDASACILKDGKILAAVEEERFTHIRVTSHLGFMHSGDEYKVMALASYGKPEYLEPFREMIQIGERGMYTISRQDLTVVLGPKRLRHESFLSRHYNIAHSLQKALEEKAVERVTSFYDPSMQARLNEIKDREDFRPVAPVVLEEDAPEWFDKADYSPFMLFVYNVSKEKAHLIPAVRHVDGTARIQTINPQQHPEYYGLLKAFKELTGVPVLVNTSFNTLGKPIVCTPRDAVECFWSSPFDALVIGSFIIEKQTGYAAQDRGSEPVVLTETLPGYH